jgi:hypothetical protein
MDACSKLLPAVSTLISNGLKWCMEIGSLLRRGYEER